MRRLIKPVAVYDSDSDFIAIAEGIDIPVYFFTYQVEMVQFYFEDATASMDKTVLDHTLIARKHAQTIATLIADETRLSSHTYEDPEEIFDSLIRHQPEYRLQYLNHNPDVVTMPLGMAEHDVYLLQ